ncbi:Nucleoside permease NupX [Stieleria bergensis]|uniref:Nucleoside permease NupX n=1 Tax=Stieleria bergensis TaxID=2528025 RepID=A0A517ST33_9BACT|nr:Nucleoside permease NupX [Planctomycetes bacterium SV_7m_r]
MYLIGEVSHLNFVSLIGIVTMLALAVAVSSDRKRIPWRLVGIGLGLQAILAAMFFNSQSWTFPKTHDSYQSLATLSDNQPLADILDGRFENVAELKLAVQSEEVTTEEISRAVASGVAIDRFHNGIVFWIVESFFGTIQESVNAGASFVFNVNPDPVDTANKTHPRALLTTFAFGVLPTVIFFAALTSVLYYLGVMQRLIRAMAWVMQKTLRVSGAESLAAAANVFVGHTEAPLVIKPYINAMTRSELNALMVGGFATISGSLIAIFASLGVSAGHLLTASIISAPAALVLAKIMQPETEQPQALETTEAEMDQSAVNVLQAAADGASEGLKLALNIGAMLIAFLALIMFMDILLQGLGGLVGIELSLQRIFGTLFYPMGWIMGIEPKDCTIAGNLLGKKLIINEFVAYMGLLESDAQLSERSKVILTYALCGFSNFGAIGIQLGGIGPLAPKRKKDLAQLGLRAMFGGMLACCMTACIAGVMFGILSE